MELKSIYYIIFITITSILYFALSKFNKAQKYVIFIANLFFIFSVVGIEFLAMFFLIMFSYIIGILIEKTENKNSKNKAKSMMYIGVLVIVLILCYFKFFKNVFIPFKNLLSIFDINISNLIAPIGLSYYSLTMISYIVDIYHGKCNAEKSLIDYLVFITFFPSIIQGPINSYSKISNQLKTNHYFDEKRVVKGFQRILFGYFKKVVIADRIGIFVTEVLKADVSNGYLIIFAMLLYSIEIYTDFSGGIDVIMGVSEVLDIELCENFRSPLMSRSVTEYWQRWHISLGNFMEKYIYYPIVLNKSIRKIAKKFKNKYLRNVFSATVASLVVFIIVGIWHGTGWNYVVYGCYQAFFVSTAILLSPIYEKIKRIFRINNNMLSYKIFQIIRTYFVLTIGRFFIRARDLETSLNLIKKTFNNLYFSNMYILFDGSIYNYGLDCSNFVLLFICIAMLFIVEILCEKQINIRENIMKQDVFFRYSIYMLLIFGIIVFGIYGPEFSSKSFIYEGF